MQHKEIEAGSNHILHNWKVADTIARDALVVAIEDIDKVCLVTADDFYYRLKSISPSVWVQVSGSGGGGSSVWGSITGTLANQADLKNALALKADKIGTSDIEITDATKGVILKSANGTRYRITVDNDGSLITTAI